MQTTQVLSNLPERVRITWPHHRLFGTDVVVHGWLHVGGEIHLRTTLTDGSIGCLPVGWTNVLDANSASADPRPLLNPESVRALQQLVEALAGRRSTRRRVRSTGPRS